MKSDSEKTKKKLQDLRNAGHTYAQIAERFSRSIGWVQANLKRTKKMKKNYKRPYYQLH